MKSIVLFEFCSNLSPPRSKWKYKLSAIMLALLMVYVIFCAVVCSIQAANQGGGAYSIMLFSVIVTYGGKSFPRVVFPEQIFTKDVVYIASSFFAFDPWHIFTSFLPYMLLSPTYINILNMSVADLCVYQRSLIIGYVRYAFSNLDDVSFTTYSCLPSLLTSR